MTANQTEGGATRTVWKTLSKIDVSKHVEKKGQLTYLSWTWAINEIMKVYPSFDYHFNENEVYPDGSVMVHCDVLVAESGVKVKRTMWLPVMDNRNNAISNPSSRQVSDTRMRCLTKGIAMLGLGFYIYAGEDLPQVAEEVPAKPQPKKAATAATAATATAPDKSDVTNPVAANAEEIISLTEKSSELEAIGKEIESGNLELSEEDVKHTVDLFVEVAQKMHCKSRTELYAFYNDNKQVVDACEKFPDKLEEIKARFTEIYKSLPEEESNNG